jgi:alpha-glucosidase
MRTWSIFVLSLLTGMPVLAQSFTVLSPDGEIRAVITVDAERPSYYVEYKGVPVIRSSALGFGIRDQQALQANLEVVGEDRQAVRRQWETVWGERSIVSDHFNELTLQLQEQSDTKRRVDMVFRVYDDGLGFRYVFPKQPNLTDFIIDEEFTEFAFAQNYQSWWIPAYRNQRYEYQYLRSAVSSIDVAHTPLTLEGDGVAVAVHEAALVDYASMTLRNIDDNQKIFRADLVPWSNGVRVYASAPMKTPWRTIQIADRAVDLMNSDLLLNLNEPNALGDVSSYVKPGKYMGIWWEMHTGLANWSPGPDQGATTARAKQYIDFAAKHDIDGVLVEGWNKGWEGEWWRREPTFLFDQPVEGFDIEEVSRYAQEKGLRLIGHHETAAGISHYEAQMDKAFAYYQRLGVTSVKMGYVGTRLEHGKEWHHGQFMVRHFQKVVETAAKYGVMVNAHETIKDTGLRRTYPNLMTRESVRGMEYNGGSPDTGNLPNHTVLFPFTRGLAGPTDFTPGVFKFDYQKHRPFNRVPTTLAKQLALYVTIYSPLQMAADLPEHYEGHPAFAFVDDVPTDWQQSIALDGEVGEFMVVARQDRHSSDWYVGAASNELPRQYTLQTDFLTAGETYIAEIYADGENAHWRDNPMDYQISQRTIRAGDTVLIDMKPGGGTAIRFSITPKGH